MSNLDIGNKAPDFTLVSSKGTKVSLHDFAGKKSVVVYFYPKDHTPGCTMEACEFRDQYADFTDAGAEVIGISNDGQESHDSFASKHQLPFILLSDPDGKVRESFGVEKSLWVLPGRVTFVIDRDGIVRHRFSSMLNMSKHVHEALRVLKELDAKSPREQATTAG